MYSRSFLRTILPVLGLVTVLAPTGNAVVSNRIASAITESRAPLQHTVSPRAKSAVDLGSAPASLKLEGLTMRFNMTDAQQAALSQLLLDQQNPGSPRYHQWLTPQQFGAQFGLSADDISKVSSWLTAEGFTVTGVANSFTFITFSGTAAQVQQAFGTAIHSLSENGQKHVANLIEPTLPAAIAGVVSTISGLNDFRPRPHLRAHQRAIHPQNTVTTSSGTEHFIAPGDFYTIYDVNALITTDGFTGAGIGQCSSKPAGTVCGDIAVMGQVDLNSSAMNDVKAFRTAAGLNTGNLPTSTLAGTDPGSPTQTCINNPTSSCVPSLSDLQESLLDVEWAGATAPGANILFVTSTNVINTSLVQAIDNNLAPIMSVSYGACENSFSASDLNTFNLAFEQASSQGITIFAPAGDDGATDCDTDVSSATQGLAVDFPGSSPYVTSLGGTMFNEGAGTYWNSANGANGGSATGYIPEAAWNETSADITGTSPSFGAGGGGASAYFAKPAWQVGNGVPSDYSRDVPDVSLNAASNHDGYLVCILSSCVNGNFYDASGNGNVFGGTSVGVPSFAGVIALVEQKLGGGRLGNINQNIYALAGSTQYNSIFHDITSGNNNSPCTGGTPNCPSNGGSIGYTAGTGYDQASGWGSIDAFNLANVWPLVTPFGPTTPPVGSFTLTPSTASTAAKAGSTAPGIVFTLTPVNGFTGPIALSATSSQSIAAGYTFTINNSNTPVNSVIISSNASVATTFTLSAFQNTQGAARSLKLASSHPPAESIPWYVTGSGATLACMFLLVLPRRRRWGAFLAVIISVGAIGAVGCGSSSSTSNSSTTNPVSGNTTPGTYTIMVTASTGTGLTKSSTVTFTVQ